MEITGSWPAPSSVSGWTNVMVHIPSYGAWDPQTEYQVTTGTGAATVDKIVNQAQQQNAWVSLGTFDLSAGASVSLSNVTYSGLGEDIAWNGLAYVPSSKPVYQYVALGDSYTVGQGYSPYTPDSAYSYDRMVSNCDRSVSEAYPDMIDVPGTTETIAFGIQQSRFWIPIRFPWLQRAVDDPDHGERGRQPVGPLRVGEPGAADVNVPAWDAFSLGYNELPQADQGYLTPSTNLVTHHDAAATMYASSPCSRTASRLNSAVSEQSAKTAAP